MLELKQNPTLRDLQAYVAELELERGFDGQGLTAKCLLLGEEVGELFKAVRKSVGLSTATDSHVPEAADEIADVLIFLLSIANRLEVDVEGAFREKERKNSQRAWR